MRFYDKHKSICDEISGNKTRHYIDDGVQKEIRISKVNFIFGIKRLGAFIIDNIHYISDIDKRNYINKTLETLENDFLNDETYLGFIKNHTNLNTSEKVLFEELYFNYLTRCLDLSNDVFNYLQKSLMITTKDVEKFVKYHDTKTFFQNLSNYRDEMSNNLSNYKLTNSLDVFKKVIGYNYTYRFMMDKKELVEVEQLINIIYSYLLNRETIKLIINYNADIMTSGLIEKARIESSYIKKMLFRIYMLTNLCLSQRGILPKVDKTVYIDDSLI